MRTLLILVSISIFISCKDGEELNGDLITINSTSIGAGNLYYIFTSSDNTILKTIDASTYGSQKIQIVSEEISQNGIYNLHRLYISEGGRQIRLDSYFNVTLKYFDFSNTSCVDDDRTIIGSSFATFYFQQDQEEFSYLISSPNEADSGTRTKSSRNPLKPKRIDLFEGHDFIYTFLTNGDRHYFKYFENLKGDMQYEFSIDTNNMTEKVRVLSLEIPDQNLQPRSSFVSISMTNSCSFTAYSLYSAPNKDSTAIEIFEPIFNYGEEYRTSISLQRSSNQLYKFILKGELPESIPALDFDIHIEDFNVDNLSFSVTGDDNYHIRGTFNGDVNNEVEWNFVTNETDAVQFPSFPESILHSHPNLSTASQFFQTDQVRGNILVYKMKDISYEDLLSNLNYYYNESNILEGQILQTFNFDLP